MTESKPRPKRAWVQWALLAIVFVALYGWMTRGTASPLVDEPAPSFSLPVAAGPRGTDRERVSLDRMRDRVVVLEFWASWCRACQSTTPILNDLFEEFEEREVDFYAVNVERIDRQRLEAAHLAFGTAFPTLHDRSGEVQRRYAIRTLPTILVIDREGVIRWASSGIPSKMRLRGAIDAALN